MFCGCTLKPFGQKEKEYNLLRNNIKLSIHCVVQKGYPNVLGTKRLCCCCCYSLFS
jgi:hypothetical protein